MRVALLDHDSQQRKTLERLLKATRHECTGFSRPDALKSYLMANVPDLLLLHWPDSDDSAAGLALLSSLREQWPQLALLVIVSRSPGDAALRLLATSPAEVLLKPLRRNELLLRLRLLLDRYCPDREGDEAITYGPYEFFTGLSQLRVGNKLVTLTQKEFELALLFFRHLGRPLSRAYIHETVWSREAELSSRTLDTHVSRVRNKLGLGRKPGRGYRLVPVYSFGYRLEQITE